MKITTKKLQQYKKDNKKIAAITAYDYSTAKVFDSMGIDVILIGDSLGQVVLGYESTNQVSVDEMKIFTSAVKRGVQNALIVSDMPFLSYQTDIKSAVLNAGELIKAGADAVKVEGNAPFIIDTIKRLVECGIAVVGHLGFTPQFLNTIGGHFVIGKNIDAILKMRDDAIKLQEAGAFMIVLEMVPKECTEFLSKEIDIPLIGIGAGVFADGQILVSDDVLGKYADFCPKFARKYADFNTCMANAIKNYIDDVKNLKFPNDEESFLLKVEEKEKLEMYRKNI